MFSGDFDGDGYSDILAAEFAYYTENGVTVKYHTGFKIYKRTATSSTIGLAYTVTFPANEKWQVVNKVNTPKQDMFFTADFTGDGRDDIMINKLGYTSTGGFQVDLFRLYTSTSSGGSTCTFNVSDFNPPTISGGGCNGTYNRFAAHLGDGQYFFPGDFNGDGAMDFLTVLSGGSGYKAFLSFPRTNEFFKEVSNLNPNCYVPTFWIHADYHFAIEFDGDGKTEILITKDVTSKIYSFELSGTNWIAVEKYNAGYPTKWHLLYFGDFNGDNKTDILTRTSKTNNNDPWYITHSTGTGFDLVSFTFSRIPSITGSGSDDKFVIADFNGDGKQDICQGWNHFVGGSASTCKFDIYYSKGSSFYIKQENYNGLLGGFNFVSYDLNGDGRSDIINRNYFQDPFTIFYFRTEGQEHLLQKIKNGYNHNIEFQYKRMTQTNNFFIRGAITTHPVNNIQIPMYLVSKRNVENGIGGNQTTDYFYEEAKLHKEGKGFLGFKIVESRNLTTGFKSISENELNSTYFVMIPFKESVRLTANNSLMSETTMTNQFVGLGGKRFWFRVNNTYENNAFEGRFVSAALTYDNNTNGNVTQKVVNNSNVETMTLSYTYGQHGTPIPAKVTSMTETNQRAGEAAYSVTTSYTYNSLGQLTGKTDFSGLPKSVLTSYTYNSFGNPLSVTTSPSGLSARTESRTYDTKGRFPVTTTNVLGQVSTATYDSRWGKPLTMTGIDGLQLTYTYDAFGRTITQYDPQKNFTISHYYNFSINVSEGTIYSIHSTHPGRPNSTIYYDLLDREKINSEYTFGINQFTTQKTTYDQRGNVATQTQPYKNGESILTTSTLYDTYNRASSISNTLGTTTYSYVYNSGNLTATVTNPASQVSSKISDPAGRMISSTDNGGTLTYTYYSHGNNKEVKSGSTTLASNEYDVYSRQTKLIDINAGTTQYVTNSLGQMSTMTSANGQTFVYSFDLLGRQTYYGRPEGSSSFTYFGSNNGGATNRLQKITSIGSIEESYTYDTYGRMATKTEKVDGINHVTTFTYTTYDDIESITYPSGFKVNYNYDSNGFLTTIKNGDNTVTLFTNVSMNGLGQHTSYTLGNGKTTTKTYHFGTPTQYSAPGVQNLTFTWNYASGNLISRYDAIKAKTESFTYDNLNRLTGSTGNGMASIAVNYATSGNITFKTDVGNYSYDLAKIHAVKEVSNSGGNISLNSQSVAYNSFYQPTLISENNYNLTFAYAADDQRIKSELKQGTTTLYTRYYFDNYEKHISSGTTRHIHYISNGSDLIAIVERIGSTDSYHYTYTDYLGSILAVTNSAGNIEAEQNFDPWGRQRNSGTWAYSYYPTPPVWLYRGFTGHEHLPELGLIHMNGRLYDPIVGRMLSPDNHVQMPDYTQNFNRYSYALNNPLTYTDPDGEVVFTATTIAIIIASSAVGGLVSGIMSEMKQDGSFWKGFVIGAVAGAVSAGLGPIVASAGIGGFYGGAIVGASAGISGSVTNSIWEKQNFGQVLGNAAKAGLIGGLIGGVIGGLDAEFKGQRFLDGKGKKVISRYLTGTGSTPAEGQMNLDGLIKNSEVVGDGFSNIAPDTRGHITGSVNSSQFEGDLSIKVRAFPQEGETFFINIDGKEVFSTSRGIRTELSLKSGKNIGWGIRGNAINRADYSLINGKWLSVDTKTPSYLIIKGNWRSWAGFLFW